MEITFTLGQCYEFTLANGTIVKFKFIGEDSNGLLGELFTNQNKVYLHVLLIPFIGYREILCE